jgi:acyl carrier protein
LATDKTILLNEVENVYHEVRGGIRTLRPEDLLEEDLDIDSLLAMEILVALENRYGIELVGDTRTTQLRTIDDLVELLASQREHRGVTARMNTS